MASQLPAGALVDAASSKTAMAVIGLLGIGASALMLAIWPTWRLVIVAQVLHAFASCMVAPAIAAISLALMGHVSLGERLGHNTRYASIGNALAAAVLGALGYYASEAAMFLLTAVLMLPGLLALAMIRPGDLATGAAVEEHAALIPPKLRKGRTEGIGRTLIGPQLLIFGSCAAAFALANTAMLPLVANEITQRAGRVADLFVSVSTIGPQIVVALVSPWVGRAADRSGRRPLLLLGFAAVPVRGLVLTAVSSPPILVLAQALDGISSAVLGVMVPLIAADLTRRSGRLTLCMGAIGLAIGLGATLSTALAGAIADRFGITVALLGLTLAGLAALGMLALMMPETSWHRTPPGGLARTGPQRPPAAAR
jgi:MFS family permease